MNTEPHTPVELFWQAFRYASDEMTAAEREAFETVLANDQSAREAVARVVELEGLVRSVENAPVEVSGPRSGVGPASRAGRLSVLPREQNYWLQPLGWVAVGAAACLATVMAFQAWWPAAAPIAPAAPQVAVGSNTSHGSELALAWAQAQAELPAPDDTMIAGSSVTIGEAVADENIEHDLASVGDDQISAAPSWLLAAVADAEAARGEN
ncbi:MAG TPA: hypothetical protein VG433_14355 [Pirellulales bacterium]|nr:hypothetical protein [Pirellulales bacterium]